MKYDIFISYRRDGGEYTARILRDQLTDLGYNVFFDVESLRSGDFNAELYKVIENCDDFLIVLSPGALDRCVNPNDWVKNEIAHAISKGKNIVPVLMRGFTFPDNLPESIASLPKYNGLEANSQFFDAFIEKLQEFLVSRPPVSQRIKQNPLFRKSLPLIIAAAVVIAGFIGVKTFIDTANSTYPRTKEEKNITDSVCLAVLEDFTNINLTAGYAYRLLDTAENYLVANDNNFASFRNEWNIITDGIKGVYENVGTTPPSFVQQLYSSPFSPSDVESLNEQTGYFCEEWLDKAEYIKYLVSDDCWLEQTEKLQVIDCYRTILEQSLVFYANCYGNGILVTVADFDYLNENMFIQNAAYLEHIPFDWSGEKEVILNRINASLNSIENATQQFSAITGGENTENAELRKNMVQTYMLLGYTFEEAKQKVSEYQQKVDKVIADTEEIRRLCQPAEEDSIDMLWYKMSHLLAIECTDDARKCADMFYDKIKEDDPYSHTYIPAVRRITDYIEDNGVVHGVMVVAYDGTEHPVLNIGDLIIAFDGVECCSFEQYTEYKKALKGKEYTLTVMRFDSDGNAATEQCTLSTDMPLVGLSTLVYHESMLQQ